MTPLLTLYGRPGCHLCDVALDVVRRVQLEHPFTLAEVDIDTEDGLLKRYLERIPVLALDGTELYDFFVDEADLRTRLAQDSPRPQPSKRDPLESRPRMSAPDLTSQGAVPPVPERLSMGVAARLARYLQVLTQARREGKETVSSQELSTWTKVNSTQIRRDLSGFGKFGKRGVGYNVDALVAQIRKILRTAGPHNIALFGAGHLGRAIASSDIFADHGFSVVAVFDNAPDAIGSAVGHLTVRPVTEVAVAVEEEDIVVGVLAVPNAAAQEIADVLVSAQVKIIFNYSEALLQVPPEVTVHTSSPAVDLLYALYFHLT